MESLKNNKILIFAFGIVILNIAALLSFKVVIDKAADKVIERLQKEYSPSPYGPGFDPDKVDPDNLKSNSKSVQVKVVDMKEFQAKLDTHVMFSEQQVAHVQEVPENIHEIDAWRNEWESDRGF